MTSGHAASPHDPEASLRAELSAKIAGAQSVIESKLAELRNALASAQNGLAITQADSQLRGLSTLQQRISTANASGLSAIRGEVAATIAATQALVQQTQQGASATQSAQVALTQASEAARSNVNDFVRDYYDQKKFDRYLQFASTEDEQEYRQREANYRREIGKAQAEHTPEGDLRANQLSIEQLKDAGAHGASKSPDFQPTLQKLENSGNALDTAIKASSAKQIASAPPQQQDVASGQSLSDALTPEILASIRAAKIAVADQGQVGHGVTAQNTSTATAPSRA